ncbi:hypothetical protein RYX36_029163, partial [Vicia faba]
VWIQWRDNNILSLIDREIYDPSHHSYILSEAALHPPSKPAFILMENMLNLKRPEECQSVSSINN